MKLYTFEQAGVRRVGTASQGQLIDLQAACAAMYGASGKVPRAPEFFSEMTSLIRAGSEGLETAQRVCEHAAQNRHSSNGARVSYAFDEVTLCAPIPRPAKILCSGVNFRGHLEENPDAKLPESPFFFSKLPSVVIGPGQPIIHPGASHQVDFEVELAVVIGKILRHAPAERVMQCIAGYTILHDVSARDVQFKDGQITLGKNFDTFAPMGPCMVTADELLDPANLRMRTLLNGEVMQDGNTRNWLYPLPELIAGLSRVMTLEPGDVVSTGTPSGTGVFRKPPVFLRPGDTVVLDIEGIGRLENPVIMEE